MIQSLGSWPLLAQHCLLPTFKATSGWKTKIGLSGCQHAALVGGGYRWLFFPSLSLTEVWSMAGPLELLCTQEVVKAASGTVRSCYVHGTAGISSAHTWTSVSLRGPLTKHKFKDKPVALSRWPWQGQEPSTVPLWARPGSGMGSPAGELALTSEGKAFLVWHTHSLLFWIFSAPSASPKIEK